MRTLLLSTLFMLLAGAVSAQSVNVTASVIDTETNEGVPGAVVTVTPVKNPDNKKYFSSGYDGKVTMALPYGEYEATSSYLGYEDGKLTFKVSASSRNAGKFLMKPSNVQIDAVVKEAKFLTSQKGDTVSYNAGSFKVTADSDVEGLLKKMPGLTVSNGTVEAQGEEVKKVFVDGKEFFGEDVTTAIKALPAQAVDRIEVYNKLSDGAEFSGMDDGEGYKAINIVTHKNMRQGQFGKMYAAYGYDADTEGGSRHKYNIGGNVNLFQGDSRLSVLALFNNVNQQNFSFEDILGVTGSTGGRGVGQYMTRPQSGVATVNMFSLNYSDTWGKRDQVSVQGTYFFAGTNTTNHSTTDKWQSYPTIDTLSTTGNSDTENYNHRFNGRIDWKISDNQSLMLRPSFSYQSNDPSSTTQGHQFGESGYNLIDNLSIGENSAYRLRMTAIYRAKLGKDGRTITLDGTGSYNNNNRYAWSHSNIAEAYKPYPDIDPMTGEELRPGDDNPLIRNLRYLYSTTPSYSYELSGNFTYTEPVSKYAQLSFQYRARYNYEERDKNSYVTGEDYSIAGIAPDPALSNEYSSGYMIHQIGPGFRYSKNKNTMVFNVNYQRSTLDGQVVHSDSEKIKHSYNDFTYFMMGQFNINRENSIRLFVSSRTENPSVTNLQSVFDVSDARYISSGNPELQPSYTHSIRMHYVNSNVEKGRTFMWMFSMNATSDYITSNVKYNGSVDVDGTTYNYLQYSQPVNMDGYWSLNTHLSYGFPIGFLKSNFNLMGGINYSLTPSQIDDMRNDTSNMQYDLRAVLGSNISENVDFTFGWYGAYNVVNNSLAASAGNNEYFSQTADGSLKVVFWKGFTFTASASYTQYKGYTNDYNDSYVLCSASIGKKLFKNKRGELSFGVNDIFNQNTSFVRTVGSGWTQNATNSVIGRYYLLTFTYNLRHFGKKGSTNIGDYNGMGESNNRGNMRPMGPGGPGGPPRR